LGDRARVDAGVSGFFPEDSFRTKPRVLP